MSVSIMVTIWWMLRWRQRPEVENFADRTGVYAIVASGQLGYPE